MFEEWGMERLEFRADANNAGSIAAMKAIGCVEEGILRNHMPTANGGRRDSIILSILKTEWLGGVKERLQQNTRWAYSNNYLKVVLFTKTNPCNFQKWNCIKYAYTSAQIGCRC